MKAVKLIAFVSLFFFQTHLHDTAHAALSTKEDMSDFPREVKWFNHDPIAKKDLSGKITLLYFWSFASPDSLRDLPIIDYLQKRYSSSGLQIIGIHCPQLHFENNDANLERSIAELNIRFPVVQDPALILARQYNTFEYPSFFIIDTNSQLRYSFQGSAHQNEIDSALFELFKQSDITFSLEDNQSAMPDLVPSSGQKVISLGFKNISSLGNSEKVKVSTKQQFQYPETMAKSYYYVSGKWRFESDRIISAEPNAKLYFHYTDSGFNLVAGTQRSNPLTAKLIVNGNSSIDKSNLNLDLSEKDGEAIFTLNPFKVYRLLKSEGLQDTIIEIVFVDEGAEIFALSTGAIQEIKPLELEERPEDSAPDEPEAKVTSTFEG